MFANMSKDEDFRMEDFFDKNITSTLEEAALAGIDPIDYITQGAYAYDPAVIFGGVRLGNSFTRPSTLEVSSFSVN